MEKLVTETFKKFYPSCPNKCISPTQANIFKMYFKSQISGKRKGGGGGSGFFKKPIWKELLGQEGEEGGEGRKKPDSQPPRTPDLAVFEDSVSLSPYWPNI